MHTAAASLCPVCVREVYGISSARKHAVAACSLCLDPVSALVLGLRGRLIADLKRDPLARCTAPMTEPSACLPSHSERAESDARRDVAYLSHAGSLMPVTDRQQHGLVRYQRASTFQYCRPSDHGQVVRGPSMYDARVPGLDQSTGLVMRSEPARQYKMSRDTAVLTASMARLCGRGRDETDRLVKAATNGAQVAREADRLGEWLTPNFQKRKARQGPSAV